jgi:hypothetical protein
MKLERGQAHLPNPELTGVEGGVSVGKAFIVNAIERSRSL